MVSLRLGPLLRYVDEEAATVWVETSRPCVAEVRCADGASGSTRTFQIDGHHYALVSVTGLTPGTRTAYEVALDGVTVWPEPDSRFPASTIAAPAYAADTPVRVTFGSCRWAAPPASGSSWRERGRELGGERDPVGPDALDTLAARLAADPEADRPDVLLLLGDQVYADETSPATQEWLARRRDLADPPGTQVADYEEYTHLYYESWLDPEIRWLLSTVPSCMLFDDHDVIDDWNTSAAWLRDMRATPWWQERILSGLMSYWVHQHIGNLPPSELAADPVYAAVRESPDGTDVLREFAMRADADPTCARWSYRRDFGRVRLVMVDTRAARVLDEQHRAMLDPDEERWVREQTLDGQDAAGGAYDHLLIGSSLPWLLPHLIHDAENWNAAMSRGERGPRWARRGEKLRRRADLEHWPAFPASFDKLTELVAEAGGGQAAPATVSVLGGDVHHAYIAEPTWPAAGPAPTARVLQLTCSPVHNSIPGYMQGAFRFGWSRPGRILGRGLARHARAALPRIGWRRTGGPWFGNHLMTLTLRGRSAELSLDRAEEDRGLVETDRRTLT
ncbi:alkaline phosphatase D family protein [Streptomyces sp. NPDC006552]|uniref:alkaline phosphatase D family protein n=1 Tax=Streptomyces sp. NPDC006552 TaxID=3157179 RepID=UPI0033BA0444